MYLTVKYAHICFALISVNLFVFRAALSMMESPLLKARWLKILPHINDTLLLAAAIYLMVTIRQYPISDHWLTVKFFAVLVYIVLGSITLKRAKTTTGKLASVLLAIGVFGFIG